MWWYIYTSKNVLLTHSDNLMWIPFIILSFCLNKGFMLLVGEFSYLLNAPCMKWRIVCPCDSDFGAHSANEELNLDDSSSEPRPSVILVKYLANNILPQLMLPIFHQYIALNFIFFKGNFPPNFKKIMDPYSGCKENTFI